MAERSCTGLDRLAANITLFTWFEVCEKKSRYLMEQEVIRSGMDYQERRWTPAMPNLALLNDLDLGIPLSGRRA